MPQFLMIAVLYLFCSTWSIAQKSSCDCASDFAFLHQYLKQTISFKQQIKGKKKQAFEAIHSQLQQKAAATTSTYECFGLMRQLLLQVKDKHLGIKELVPAVSQKQLQDAAFAQNYQNSPTFFNSPRVQLNLDSLEKVLHQAPKEAIAGIYYYYNFFKIGIYPDKTEGKYWGIVLESKIASWEKGQIILQLNHTKDNVYEAISGHRLNRHHVADEALLVNGQIIRFNWRKDTTIINYFTKTNSNQTFALQQLAPNIQYLKLGSFNAFEGYKKAKNFADSITNLLKAPHLIVDVRGNTGGGDRTSNLFLKLLKKYAKHGSIYVLTNYYTVSNGEIFTSRLKRLPTTTVLGMRTNGSTSYGRENLPSLVLPSKKFRFYRTNMNYSQFLNNELVGITPDVLLDFNRDWLEQTIKYINKQ